ncbi:hypothetical protein JW851_00620 [Candidatus Woesearchaeota archaeon]|nr:hypothetical protein [Candidatus Woesearchaeota archaeon]
MNNNAWKKQNQKQIFTLLRNGAYLARCCNLYLSIKGQLEETLERKRYEMKIERRYLRISRFYMHEIKEKSKLHEQNGLEKKIDFIKKEANEVIGRTYPSHYLKLSEEFPDIIQKKPTYSSKTPTTAAKN